MTTLVVFDCDGTLVDSQRAIVESVRVAFEAYGLAVPPDEAIRRVVGLSVPEAMAVLLPPDEAPDIAALSASFKDAFMAYRARYGVADEPLFPGIRESLADIEAAGHLLAIATGKSQRGLEATLGQHGLLNHFVSLQTADRHPSKPHPAMLEAAMRDAGAGAGETILVGDTSYDMMMANAAGAGGLGVAWGYHPPEELRAAGAVDVVESGSLLRSTIETYFAGRER